MNASLLVAPTGEPVSLAETKAWLRLNTGDEDALVAAAIVAARQAVEAATRRLLVAQTWRFRFDAWPDCVVTSPLGSGAFIRTPALPIPFAPVASIIALRCSDASGIMQVVSSTTYRLCGAPDDAHVVFTTAPPPPGIASGGIELDAVLGYGAPSDVPAPLRQALLATVARIFENRGDEDTPSAPLVCSVARDLVAPFRRVRLA